MVTKNGFPVVNNNNILDIFYSLGIKKWEKIGTSVLAENYPGLDLNSEEECFRKKFKIEISEFLNPKGNIFKGFHLSGGSGTRVFTLLEGDFVPICGEFQHGCGEIVFDLPGGRIEDGEDPASCAKREFEEESGIILEDMVSLGQTGMLISARHLDSRNFSFVGVASKPLRVKGQVLDRNEFLKVVLIELGEWLKLIDHEMVQAYSASTTFLALRKLNRGTCL